MFCGKCGAKNNDGAIFCSSCGAEMDVSHSGSSYETITPKRISGKMKIAIIVVIVVGIFFSVFGVRGYKSTVRKYIDASMDGDVRAILKLFPDKVIDQILEDEGYDDDEFNKLVKDGKEKMKRELDYLDRNLGKDWTMSYKIIDTENITGDDLEDLREEYDVIGVRVLDAKQVEVEITVRAGATEQTRSKHINLVRVGFYWYLDYFS